MNAAYRYQDVVEGIIESTQVERDFHGAALIDGCGREIPITETMVQQALERATELPSVFDVHFTTCPEDQALKN